MGPPGRNLGRRRVLRDDAAAAAAALHLRRAGGAADAAAAGAAVALLLDLEEGRRKRFPVLLVEPLGDEFGEADVVHGGEELAVRHILLRWSCGCYGQGFDEERSLGEEAPTLHV